MGRRGIIINTYWGTEKKHHVLCLDNHSPSWIKRSLIQCNQSFAKASDKGFKTLTADGSNIQGDVGVCDSLSFENIVFKKIPFYVMPDSPGIAADDDGVFGIEAMSAGVWLIDFKNAELTFTSGINSLSEISQAELIPATFNQDAIAVSVDFGDNIIIDMDIDLGYNGFMLMPPADFKKIGSKKKAFINADRFTTPAGGSNVESSSFLDTVSINHDWLFTIVSSNSKVKERIIGINFFKRFDHTIFDFINKKVYIAKKV